MLLTQSTVHGSELIDQPPLGSWATLKVRAASAGTTEMGEFSEGWEHYTERMKIFLSGGIAVHSLPKLEMWESLIIPFFPLMQYQLHYFNQYLSST